ncbi:hypothetical protein QTP88_020942 [Uroleucon formosanum]
MKELREQNMKLTETNDKLSSKFEQNEDCKNTVKEIISKLNIECDVVKAYRILSKQKTDTKIIAWLSDTNAKNQFLITAKKNKWIANQYQSDWPTSKIYINNHLKKFKRLLLGRSKSAAKYKNYKYVWTSGTDILIRKDENTKVIRINDENDLDKII